MSFPFRRTPRLEDDPSVTIVPRGPGWKEFGLTTFLLTAILALSWHFAGLLLRHTNTDLGPVTDPVTGKVTGDQDQKHNLSQTLRARSYLTRDPSLTLTQNLQRWMPHDTDGVVAPLWPWVAARLAKPEHALSPNTVSDEDRDLFLRGKKANVLIALVFLWALGLIMARSFRPAAAVTVLLLGAFGAMIPRAVYYQPETLYYIFFFLGWICAVKLLLDNKIWLHGLFGIVCGVAYLAKTSVEPLLMCWFLVATWRFLRAMWRREDLTVEHRWTCRNHFLGLFALVLGWLAIVGPRYAEAQEKWGDVRHSYPGYWMWFDDFGDCFQWMTDHPDRKSLEAIPAGEKPSLSRYARTHTAEQMRARLEDGYWEKMSRFLAPKTVAPKKDRSFTGWKHLLDLRGVYLGSLAGIFVMAAVITWWRRKSVDRVGMSLPCGAGAAGLFVTGTLFTYALAYGWYTPIGRGDRFMLSLYLPLVFCLVWGSERLMTLAEMRRAPRWTGLLYQSLLWALNAAVVWRLVEILRRPEFDPGTL